MKKTFVSLVAAVAAIGLLAAPAAAGTRRIHKSFTAHAIPLPNYGSHTGVGPGCAAGVEGVHKVTKSFKAPGTGKLTVSTEGFLGDWDLYVFDSKGTMIGSSDSAQVPDGAPAEEQIKIGLRKGKTVKITACNWAGGPEAEVHYMYVYRT